MSNAHVISTCNMLPRDKWWMDNLGPLSSKTPVRYDPPDSPLTPSFKSIQQAVKQDRHNPMASHSPRFNPPKNVSNRGPGDYHIDTTAIGITVNSSTINNQASTVINSSTHRFRKDDGRVDLPPAKWSLQSEAKQWTNNPRYKSTMKTAVEPRMYNPASLHKMAQEARYNTNTGNNKSLAKSVTDSPICYSSAFKSTTDRFAPLAGYQQKNFSASAKEPYSDPTKMGPGRYHVRQTGGKNHTAIGVVSGVTRESGMFVSKSPRFVKPPKCGAHGAGYSNTHARARGLLVLEDEQTQLIQAQEAEIERNESEFHTQAGVMAATAKAQWDARPGKFISNAPRFRAKTFPEPLNAGAAHSTHSQNTYVSEAPDVDYQVEKTDLAKTSKVRRSRAQRSCLQSRTQRFNSSGCYQQDDYQSTGTSRSGGRGGILSGDAVNGSVSKAAAGLRGPMQVLDKVGQYPIGRGRLHPKFNGQPLGTKAGGVTQAMPGKVKGYSPMQSSIPRFRTSLSAR